MYSNNLLLVQLSTNLNVRNIYIISKIIKVQCSAFTIIQYKIIIMNHVVKDLFKLFNLINIANKKKVFLIFIVFIEWYKIYNFSYNNDRIIRIIMLLLTASVVAVIAIRVLDNLFYTRLIDCLK